MTEYRILDRAAFALAVEACGPDADAYGVWILVSQFAGVPVARSYKALRGDVVHPADRGVIFQTFERNPCKFRLRSQWFAFRDGPAASSRPRADADFGEEG